MPALPERDKGILSAVSESQPLKGHILLAAKGSGIIFTGKLFEYALQIPIVILLARLLMAEQYGQYKLTLTTISVVASLTVLGLRTGLVRYISLYANRQDMDKLSGTLQLGIGIPTVFGVLISIAVFLSAKPIAYRFFHEPELVTLIKFGSLVIPFLSLNAVLGAAFKGFSQMKYLAVAESFFQPIIKFILLLVFAFLGLDAIRAIAANNVAAFGVTFVLFFFLNKVFPLKHRLRNAEVESKKILKFSLPVYLSNMVKTIQENIYTILLGALSTIENVGVFSIATRVNIIGSFFHSSIVSSSMPIMTAIHDRGNNDQLRLFFQTTSRWSFTLNLPMFLLVVLFPAEILSIFGKSFQSGVTPLIILAWANLVNTGSGLCGALLDMTGHTTFKLVNSIVTAFITIGLSLWLIPSMGIVGAALAVLFSEIVINFLRVIEIYVLYRILPFNLGFFKIMFAGCGALFAVIIMEQFILNTTLFISLMKALVLIAVYVSLIMAFGLSKEDQVLLEKIRHRKNTLFSR
jgi:O-antigen/teichoic acid export membrane protein